MVLYVGEYLLKHIETLLDLRHFGKCRIGTNHIKQRFGVVKLMFQLIIGVLLRESALDGLIRLIKTFAQLL